MYKLAIAAAACFFSFILWIIYLADSGGSSIFFDFVRSFPYGDKLGHFFLFGTLTLILVIATKFKSFFIGELRIFFGLVLVALFVIGEEVSQAFIPSRTFDLVDLTADIIGMLTSVTLACFVEKHLTKGSK